MRAHRLLLSPLLSLLLAFAPAFPSLAAGKLSRLPGGDYRLFDDSSSIGGVFRRGVDVSHWQGEIDWQSAAADDVGFVMLGTRYQGEIDPLFRQNAEQASAAGVRLGAYIYSYATSVEMAEQEADFILDLVKDYPISYPIAFDAENAESLGSLPKEEITKIIRAFCEKISAAGYYPILYANDYWLRNKLDMEALSDYPVWAAAYERTPNYEGFAMWQGTDSGKVSGIAGGVDIDLQFVDFGEKIPADGWKRVGGIWYYYRDFRMQKDALIFDGSHSYYMDAGGRIFTGGWKTLDSKRLYFSPSTGEMRTGWEKIGGAWHYFAADGNLQSGWIQDGGFWYYSDREGVMQTGLVEADGKRYFLGADGAMYHDTVIELDGKRWSIDGGGVMSEYREAPPETGGGEGAVGSAPEETAAEGEQPAAPAAPEEKESYVQPAG